MSKSNTSKLPKRRKIPITKHITDDTFPLFLGFTKDIALGTIINKVHQPSKNMLMSVTPVLFKPQITPITTKTIPHKIRLKFFI